MSMPRTKFPANKPRLLHDFAISAAHGPKDTLLMVGTDAKEAASNPANGKPAGRAPCWLLIGFHFTYLDS